MPLPQTCPSCNSTFNVPDTLAGKAVKCPQCKGVVRIAAADGSAPKASGKSESWTVKTADGQEYGPVSRSELDQWVAEGRLTVECQVLKQGAAQWNWAADIYPALNTPSPVATTAAVGASSFGGASFGEVNPYGAVSTASPTSSAFRAREYPMLKLMQTISYVIAGIIGLVSLLTICVILFGALAGAGASKGASLGMGLISAFAVTLYAAMMIVYVLATGEVIRLMMDMQANTQETAQNTRHLVK